MESKKLFELLTLVDWVVSSQWKTVMELVNSINGNEPVIIINKQWHDGFKNSHPEMYPLDLTKIGTWSTFEGTCINLKFHVNENNLHCDVKIYDGESFDGCRRGMRFTAQLILPKSFINNIEYLINYAFEGYLEDAYENHLESKKSEWINKLKGTILEK